MASPPPSSEAQIASPAQKASVADTATPVTDVEMDPSMSEAEDASPPPNRPNQPKMTPRAIGKRRRRNASRAVKKSLQDISSGSRLARQHRDQFNYQQKQNRAWLQHQVQLPSRGGVPRHAELELQALFRKDTPADPATNLPMLGAGITLSEDAQAAWQQLRSEREAVTVEMGWKFTPDWFMRGDLSVVKRTKGEKRAATRERKKAMEEEAEALKGFALGAGKSEGQEMVVDEDQDEMDGGVEIA